MLLEVLKLIKEMEYESKMVRSYIEQIIVESYTKVGQLNSGQNIDFETLVKLLTFLFEKFFNEIEHKEQIFLILLQFVDKNFTSLLSVIQAFQLFVLMSVDNKSHYTNAIGQLFLKLPSIILIDEEFFQRKNTEY